MKSKYTIWKRLFSLAGLIGLAGLTSCTKLKSEFSYSPTQPCAGGEVAFTNESTGADDYVWTFGDNTSSTSQNPYHIFRKPGTYTVTLQIIRNKVEKRSCSHQVMVIDTVPTLCVDSDSLYTYTPHTYSAAVYNPWKKTLKYAWQLPEQAVVLSYADDSSTITCYYTQAMANAKVQLQLQQGEKSFALSREDDVYHNPATSVLYLANDQACEQFIYLINKQRLYQTPTLAAHPADSLLRAEQDTTYTHGTLVLDRSQVATMIGQTSITGFQVDRLLNKIYAYNTNGMWVCNINGDQVRQLLTSLVKAIKVDGSLNRLYWATNEGLFVHELMHMSGNTDAFAPSIINTENNIERISINATKH